MSALLSTLVCAFALAAPVDNDGDGYDTSVDCDDADPAINPGATEACDGVDNDCDGAVDEGATTTWWLDGDGDGYGDPATAYDGCVKPSGYALNSQDCDDGDVLVNPLAKEVCDGIDNNCNLAVDEGCGDTGVPGDTGDTDTDTDTDTGEDTSEPGDDTGGGTNPGDDTGPDGTGGGSVGTGPAFFADDDKGCGGSAALVVLPLIMLGVRRRGR